MRFNHTREQILQPQSEKLKIETMNPNQINTYLNSIYFDPSHPGSFGSPAKLYWAVQKEGKREISLGAIKKWLKSQDTYTLHRQPRRKFKRSRVYVPRIDFQWDADLMDMTRIASHNDGFQHVLLAIDIFSRYVWTVALKTKSGKEVKEAFSNIFSRGRTPKTIRTDKGTEFTNGLVKNYFNSIGVKHFVTQNETKANYAERAIKTIKGRMYKYFTQNLTHRYVDKLQDFTKAYNNGFHRSIQMSPVEVTKERERKVYRTLYEERVESKRKRHKYKIGDFVRLIHYKRPFTREYEERWTGEIFKITGRLKKDGIPLYNLEDYSGEPILGTFYESELQVVTPPETFKIEKIIKTRRRRRGQSKEHLVKWLRWPEKFNSWVSEEDIKDVN